MDIIFYCPKCEQELAVDSAGIGSEIECPSCGETIVIPEPEPAVRRRLHLRAVTAPAAGLEKELNTRQRQVSSLHQLMLNCYDPGSCASTGSHASASKPRMACRRRRKGIR